MITFTSIHGEQTMAIQDIMASAMGKVFSDHSNRYTLEWLSNETSNEKKRPFYDLVFNEIPEDERPSRGKLTSWYTTHRVEVNKLLSQQAASNDQIPLLPDEFMDSSRPDLREILPPHQQWVSRSEVIAIVNEILDKRLVGSEPVAVNSDRLLPMPPRTRVGRKENRIHSPIGTSVDIRLKELFKQECKRLKMTQSELLDQILYTYFQGPKLSYD